MIWYDIWYDIYLYSLWIELFKSLMHIFCISAIIIMAMIGESWVRYKIVAICRHFQINFLVWKLSYFNEICFQEPSKQWFIIGLDIGLIRYRRQAIIGTIMVWFTDMHASLSHNEFRLHITGTAIIRTKGVWYSRHVKQLGLYWPTFNLMLFITSILFIISFLWEFKL